MHFGLGLVVLNIMAGLADPERGRASCQGLWRLKRGQFFCRTGPLYLVRFPSGIRKLHFLITVHLAMSSDKVELWDFQDPG